MTFDAHQLDTFLLLGSLVTLARDPGGAAVLPCRSAEPAHLPADGRTPRRGAALGIQFEDAQMAHALGFAALVLILAEGGLTTNWGEIRPQIRMGVSLATVGIAVSVAVMAVGAHYLLGLPWELAILLGRGLLADRRGRGVLGAAGGAAAAPDHRCPRVRVRPQRRAHGRAGHAGLHRRGGRARRARDGRHHRLRAGRRRAARPGGRLRRRLGDAPGRAAVLRPLPDRDPVPHGHRLRRPERPLHASGFAAVYVAALVLGQRRPAAPGGHQVVLRGRRLAGPDRAVRDARPAALARPDHRRHRRPRAGRGPAADHGGPAGVGAGQRHRAADAAGGTWRSSRGPGCAVRCRSCSPPSRSPRASTAPRSSSTSSS